MTLIEVIDSARALLNEPLAAARTFPDDTSSFWTDTILAKYFNMAQQELQHEIIQTFEDDFVTQSYLSIVNGTAEYTLPSQTIKVRRVEDNRDVAAPVEIVPVTLNNRGGIVHYVHCSTFVGGGYYIRGNQIVLTDTPTFTNASAIRVHFLKALADVTAGSNTSELPEGCTRCLIWGIVKLALFQQQSDTTIANAEYQNHLTKIQKQGEDRQIQRPRKVVEAHSRGVI